MANALRQDALGPLNAAEAQRQEATARNTTDAESHSPNTARAQQGSSWNNGQKVYEGMSLLAHPAVQEYAEYQVVRGLLGEKEGQSLARPEEKARHEQVSTVLKAEEEGEISTRQAFALLDKLQEPQSQENTEVLTRDELPKMADVLQSRYDSLIKRQSGEMAEGETTRDLLDRVQKETDNENKNERIEAEPKLFETGRFAEAVLEERDENYV